MDATSPAGRWQVLGRRTAAADWSAVGEVHAPDAGMALLLAKESFFRHGEGVGLAVSRGDEFVVLDPADLLEPATDKSYRLQQGYTGIGDKRRRAAARAAAAGALVEHRRPPDRRVPGAEHRNAEGAEGGGDAGDGSGPGG